MATVHIPAQLRAFTAGAEHLEMDAANVRQLLEALESQFPGLRERLCEGEQIRPGLQVAIDGALSGKGLAARLAAKSEVYFLPAIGGG